MVMCGAPAVPIFLFASLLLADPVHVASGHTQDPWCRRPAHRCPGRQSLHPTLVRLRGGFDMDEVLRRSLSREDHVAEWRDEFDRGPDFEDLPKFNVLNPDPSEPWPPHPDMPATLSIGSRGQRLGQGELFDQQGYTNDDFEAETTAELAESRDQRAEKRNKGKGAQEFKHFDPSSIEGYNTTEGWIRDHLHGEDLALWREFEAFFKDIYPARDPETASARDIEFFLNSTSDKKRKDSFFFLPIDPGSRARRTEIVHATDSSEAQAIEKEIDEFDRAYPTPPDLIQESPIPRLVTWWHTGMGCYGYAFDIRARSSDLVVRHLHGASYSKQGPLRYKVWTTTGTWRYKCQSEQLWVLIGEGCLQLDAAEGHYTMLPLNQSVAVKAGSTQAFYVHTPDDSFGVAFRSRPHTALEEGLEHAVGGCQVVEGKGVAVDGVLYSDTAAASGDVIERNADLFGAVSASERPFEDVFEAEEFVSGWCGMIDYTVGGSDAEHATDAQPPARA